MSKRILAINPGSTSTKVALYDDLLLVGQVTIRHPTTELSQYPSLIAQLPLRTQAVMQLLEQKQISLESIDAFVGRGGLLHPLPNGGTYRINDKMIHDLQASRFGVHASNLGALIAHELAQYHHQPCFIVNPVVVDELAPEARMTGIPFMQRLSRYHALNQKAIAQRYAKETSKNYRDIIVVVAHLGGGISVGLHRHGRVIDVNNALGGDGPFSPERAGTLPTFDLMNLCFSGQYTIDEVRQMIVGNGGLVGHCGTSDAKLLVEQAVAGNKAVEQVLTAMCYQIAKEIGALYAVARGPLDGVLITGGLAYNTWIIDTICSYLPDHYNIKVYPGEDELLALVEGTLAVLSQQEDCRDYL